MEPIRVLVSGAAGLMREIVVRAVTLQSDMTLVDASGDAGGWSVERHGADVVVVVLHDTDAESADIRLRHAFSTRAVVAIDSRARVAWSYDYEFRRADEIAGELTPDAVIDVIRTSAKRMRASESAARGATESGQ